MPRSRAIFPAARVEFIKARPEARLRKWNNEINLGVRVDGIGAAAAVVEASRVKWIGANREVHAYPLEAEAGMEDGGFEIEEILKTPPPTNVFDFQIDGWGDLDFFFQVQLTAQQRAAGHSRPANVEGSYAVYHKTKKHHRLGRTNYATGKAFHIFRPRITDNIGARVWGDLSYSNGVLSVTVPQSFLDSATYPVTVDPTFGYTTIGATTYTNSHSSFQEAVLPEAGNLTQVSFYSAGTAATVNVKGLLYTNVANAPTVVVAVGAVVAVDTTPAWRDSAATGALSAGNYYAGTVDDGTVTHSFHYDSGPTNNHHSMNTNYTTPGNSPTGSTSDSAWSIYATYTAIVPDPVITTDFSQFPKQKIAEAA